MPIPTDPIGSIPSPVELVDATAEFGPKNPRLDAMYDATIFDTIKRFEKTGPPAITDGEQRKYHKFFVAHVSNSVEPAELVATVASVLGRVRASPSDPRAVVARPPQNDGSRPRVR